MNIMDNSPIEAPSVGRIVTETYEVEQLKDCHLYLLPSNSNAFANKASEVFDMLRDKMGASQLLNDYKLELLSDNLKLDNHPNVSEAIGKDHSNFVMPLFTPDSSNKKYLIVHSEEKDLFTHIPLMIYTSERLTKNSAVELMLKDAIHDTKAFLDKINHVYKTDSFLKNMIVGLPGVGILPSFGMATIGVTLLKKILGKEGKLTHQKKIELQEDFINDLNDIKTGNYNEEQLAKVKLYLGSLSNEDILDYLLSLSKEESHLFVDSVSPTKIAERSTMKIAVRYVGRIDKHHSANGRFRIFFEKGDICRQVQFGRRIGFLVYMIYLFDVIKSEKVKSIDIRNYEDLFVNLFNECYCYNGGHELFLDLYGKGDHEQGQLRHSYDDIRKTVKKNCIELKESWTPFVVSDPQSHLYVPKEKIIIDDRLLKYL